MSNEAKAAASTGKANKIKRFGVTALVVTFVVAVVVTSAAWAIITVLRPADSPLDSAAPTTAIVTEGEISSRVQVTALAQWNQTLAAKNQAVGTVTSLNLNSDADSKVGDVIYSVNLRPVVIAQGDTPAFRPIYEGLSGADVKQLQQLLATLGFFTGDINGTASGSTTKAITAWQKSLGLEQSGTVETGDVIYIPKLPARLKLNTDLLHRGATLAGGEDILSTLSTAPQFTIKASFTQGLTIVDGAKVELTSPDGDIWQAIISSRQTDSETQQVTFTLASETDAPICAEQCGQIPATNSVELPATIINSEIVTGLTVPVGALQTQSNGDTVLTDSAGILHPVTVIDSAGGIAVIEGIPEGTVVQITTQKIVENESKQ